MSRLTSVALVVLLWAGVAYGHGTVVSYYAEGGSGHSELTVVQTVPAGGFVLTDLYFCCEELGPDTIYVQERPGEDPPILKLRLDPADGPEFHFNSGIPFSAGSRATVKKQPPTGAEMIMVTMSGYIPCTNPCSKAGIIPAIGNPGLAAC